MRNIGKKTLETMSQAKWYNQWTWQFMEKYVKGEILEIGVGIGNFSSYLQLKGNVTAIDVERNYISELKKKSNRGFSVGFGDVEEGKYFFEKKKFDTLVCLNVLEHIKEDNKALENMFHLLRSGGNLVLLVPAHNLLLSDFDRSIGHFRRYSKTDLFEKLKNAGFTQRQVRYFNWWGAIGWLFWMRLMKSKQIPGSSLGIFEVLGKPLLSIEKIIFPPFGLSVYAIAKKP